MSESKMKSASVKVMRSYDYCHFEITMSIDDDGGLTTVNVDNLRKEAQRLADKAVKQYQVAKNDAARRINGKSQMRNFEADCKRIEAKSEGDRTLNEIAMLKQYKDEAWQAKFEREYDYEDDYCHICGNPDYACSCNEN